MSAWRDRRSLREPIATAQHREEEGILLNAAQWFIIILLTIHDSCVCVSRKMMGNLLLFLHLFILFILLPEHIWLIQSIGQQHITKRRGIKKKEGSSMKRRNRSFTRNVLWAESTASCYKIYKYAGLEREREGRGFISSAVTCIIRQGITRTWGKYQKRVRLWGGLGFSVFRALCRYFGAGRLVQHQNELLKNEFEFFFFSLLLPPSCRRLRRAMWNRSVHTLRNTKACFFFPRGKYYAFCCCCYSFTWWDSAKGTFKAPWRFARYVRDSRSWVCSSASLRFVSFLSLLTHFPSRGLLQSYFICYSFPLLPCFTLHTDMFVVRARLYPKRREKNCLSARFTTVLSASGVFSSEGREMHLKKWRGIRLDGSIGAVSFSLKCFFFDFLRGRESLHHPAELCAWPEHHGGPG